MGYQAGELIGKELAQVPINEKKGDLLDALNSCVTIDKVSKMLVPSSLRGKRGGLVFAEHHVQQWPCPYPVPRTLTLQIRAEAKDALS